MQWLTISLVASAVLQNVVQLHAKLALQDSPKSSEMLSNTLAYNSNNIHANDNGHPNHKDEHMNDIDNNSQFKVAQNTNKLDEGNGPVASVQRVNTKSNHTKTPGENKRKNLSTNIIKNRTPVPAAPASTPAQTAKFYRPNGFVNPFGQLVRFFGSDQLHLQDYSFLFNAERQTVFQLHTAVPAPSLAGNYSSSALTQLATSGRVLHVVGGSLGAVFGVNAPLLDAPVTRVEEVQLYNAASLRQSRFNPFNPTRILIHGWMGGSHAAFYSTLVSAYLRRNNGTYNVFTVDWGRGAIADYITASYRVKPVGKVLAKFIDFLHREAGMRYEDLHVVGFSMGAHIAGIAGKFVTTGRLAVIYALDPAMPFFRYENLDERVSIADADYVEVIHTSIGSYGYDRPLGHVDFYVNYGGNQPGCFLNECSHFRAFQVFAESLHTGGEGFVGQGCYVKMWQDLTRNKRCLMTTGQTMTMGGDPQNATALRGRGGIYYFTTPYAMG